MRTGKNASMDFVARCLDKMLGIQQKKMVKCTIFNKMHLPNFATISSEQ